MVKRRPLSISILILFIVTLSGSLTLSLGNASDIEFYVSPAPKAASDTVQFEPLFLNPSIKVDMGLNKLIKLGYSGSNITIAILDTGIMYNDIRFDRDGDLSTIGDRVVTHHVSFVTGEPDYDLNGHGTTIAGLLSARRCYVPAINFTFEGMAQNVNLWSVKVLDKDGYGDVTSIMSGLRYCLSHKDEIDIINLSFGLIKNDENKEALKQIEDLAKQCWEAGIIVVAAAGNDGDVFLSDSKVPLFTISSPSSELHVISVGAMKDNGIADFSSIGPTPYTNYIKPELVAPGADLITTYKDNGTFAIGVAGTSYASPILAGGIAILLDAIGHKVNPNLIKAALIDSAIPLGYTMYEEGAGVPNFTKALELLSSSSYNGIAVLPASLNFPNFFDPEKESIPQNVHSLYPNTPFNKIMATLIVGKTPKVGIIIKTDDAIDRFIDVDDVSADEIGQYAFGIDFEERMFIDGKPFFVATGTYTGYIRIYDGNVEEDRIYITVTITILGLIKTWLGLLAFIFFPFVTIFTVRQVRRRKRKSVVSSCPPDVPFDACKCNIEGTKCWIDPSYLKR